MLANLIRSTRAEHRNVDAMSWLDYLHLFEHFGFNGVEYMLPNGGIPELTAQQAQRNPIVWACISLRVLVFSEVSFAFQPFTNGTAGDLFTTGALQVLQEPWEKATTGDLLARMEVDASLYGNSFWTRPPGSPWLIRLDPNRVMIATTDVLDQTTGNAIGKRLVGYLLNDRLGQPVAAFLPSEVGHYKPLPDPQNEFRGISWMSSLLPDIVADLDMSDFKHSFLSNAATPNLVVTFGPNVKEESALKLKERLDSGHTSPSNAFKTLYLSSGADVKVVGSNFDQLNLNEVQAAGETRIAAVAGVPPTLLSLSEGMQGSALNAGNYAATRRRFSDATIRPLWRMASGALQTVVQLPPGGTRLWYSEEGVAFLQEDQGQAADIQVAQSATIVNLINAGFDPESIIAVVATGNFKLLKHTGMLSVQLQPPGSIKPTLPPRVPPIPED